MLIVRPITMLLLFLVLALLGSACSKPPNKKVNEIKTANNNKVGQQLDHLGRCRNTFPEVYKPDSTSTTQHPTTTTSLFTLANSFVIGSPCRPGYRQDSKVLGSSHLIELD
ncbi:hypothetical protein B566_EDAN012113 [Ephemera danica]|nr:hypothetical protein B566_EDAN012113 [Ephemera danica]